MNFTLREYNLMRFAACREGALHWLMQARIRISESARYIALARADASLARMYWKQAQEGAA